MKRMIPVLLVAVIFFVISLYAVIPHKWELQNLNDYLSGKFNGISINSDGVLRLSPKEEKVNGPDGEFFLSQVITTDGIVFLGTGHSGEIYKINKNGESELYFNCPEMDIYCLALDAKGSLYAGSSPNGKIYRIESKEKWTEFFNPPEKYIWELLFTKKGTLLAAVGESGGVYEISKDGEGGQILKAEENHILCMQFDKNDNLVAGSGGKGRIYRLSEDKTPYVLFESPFNEVKSIALDEIGNIYAATSGTISNVAKGIPSQPKASSSTDVTVTVSADVPGNSQIEPTSSSKQPGALFKIDKEGIPKKLWESKEDLIYSVIWNTREKKVYFGTGNRGRVFALDNENKISLLFQKESEQAYSFNIQQDKIYLLSNNPAELSILYPDQGYEGEYTSRVFDAKIVSTWGKLDWNADIPEGTTLQFQTRSGNANEPNKTWSQWSPPYRNEDGEQILSPKARFVQVKAIFKSQSGRVSPKIRKIILFYLQTNMSPVISQLELLPPNIVFLKPPIQDEQIYGQVQETSNEARTNSRSNLMVMAKKVERKGFQTIVWNAADENQDSILYSILIRDTGGNKWRLLKDNWSEKIFAFDTVSLPDGVYYMKIEASDSPSNPVGMELKGEKVSRSLIIDNSLPAINQFQVVRERNKLTVSFTAEDSSSYIKEVKYLIRPNEWQVVFPEDRICDSKRENFKFTITLPPGADDLITVKVIDGKGNTGVHRAGF